MQSEIQLIVKAGAISPNSTSTDILASTVPSGQDYFETGVTPPLAAYYPNGTKVEFYNNTTASVQFTTYVDMKDADGNVFPVGAGEYPLEDGKILIVGEDGKIAEVKEMEVESEMSSEDIIATINSLSQKISDLQSSLDAKNAELNAVSEELAKAKNDATVSATELAALKKAPATASVKDRKTTLSATAQPTKSWDKMTYQERVLAEIQKIQK